MHNCSSLVRMFPQRRVHTSGDQQVHLQGCDFPTTKTLENLDVLQGSRPEKTYSVSAIIAIGSC